MNPKAPTVECQCCDEPKNVGMMYDSIICETCYGKLMQLRHDLDWLKKYESYCL